MKRFLVLAFLAGLLNAQIQTGQNVSTIIVRKQTALAGTAEVITIQQPGVAPAKMVRFLGASFDCNVACTFTLERNGTAATSTTLAPLQGNPQELPPVAVAFSGSNVGVGTILGSYNCAGAAGCTPIPIDLTGIWFTASPSATQNLTLRSSAITGTVNIMFKYQEVQ